MPLKGTHFNTCFNFFSDFLEVSKADIDKCIMAGIKQEISEISQ